MTGSPIASPQIRFGSPMLQRSDAAGMRRFCDAQENGQRTKKDNYALTSGALSASQMERHPIAFGELLCLADARLDRQKIATDIFVGKQRRAPFRLADRHADISRSPGRRPSLRGRVDRFCDLAVNGNEMPRGLGWCTVLRPPPHPDRFGKRPASFGRCLLPSSWRPKWIRSGVLRAVVVAHRLFTHLAPF